MKIEKLTNCKAAPYLTCWDSGHLPYIRIVLWLNDDVFSCSWFWFPTARLGRITCIWKMSFKSENFELQNFTKLYIDITSVNIPLAKWTEFKLLWKCLRLSIWPSTWSSELNPSPWQCIQLLKAGFCEMQELPVRRCYTSSENDVVASFDIMEVHCMWLFNPRSWRTCDKWWKELNQGYMQYF